MTLTLETCFPLLRSLAMSKQSLSSGQPYGDCTESDLNIFRGMEGFEESDDSMLVALLDDLHEDTLMTLLDDNLFVKEICQHPFGEGEDSIELQANYYGESHSEDFDMEEVLSMRECLSLSEETSRECLSVTKPHHLEGNKRLRSDSNHENLPKKAKLDRPAKRSLSTGFSTAVASVMHDHCYATIQEDRHNSNANSDEETSNEEGSSSDTGKVV